MHLYKKKLHTNIKLNFLIILYNYIKDKAIYRAIVGLGYKLDSKFKKLNYIGVLIILVKINIYNHNPGPKKLCCYRLANINN